MGGDLVDIGSGTHSRKELPLYVSYALLCKFIFQKNLNYKEISTFCSYEPIKLYSSFTKFCTLKIRDPASCSLI